MSVLCAFDVINVNYVNFAELQPYRTTILRQAELTPYLTTVELGKPKLEDRYAAFISIPPTITWHSAVAG